MSIVGKNIKKGPCVNGWGIRQEFSITTSTPVIVQNCYVLTIMFYKLIIYPYRILNFKVIVSVNNFITL